MNNQRNYYETILVDTFVIDGEGIYQPLYDLLEKYPNKKIILTGANDEQFKEFGLDKMPLSSIHPQTYPEKIDPAYYRTMLEKFNLKPEDVVYFEHNPKAVESAKSVGIISYFYDFDKKDIIALKDFLDKNLK